jgi:hypothetical protein
MKYGYCDDPANDLPLTDEQRRKLMEWYEAVRPHAGLLTPEQIEEVITTTWTEPLDFTKVQATLAAYAEIVETFARWDPPFHACICGGEITPEGIHKHWDDCPFLAARKLRGKP